jgi:hypothetical protein
MSTGGPAFPTNDVCYNGMTLRDYFAAKAMPVAWGMYEELYDCSPEDVIPFVADYAYDLADAMLKRREA